MQGCRPGKVRGGGRSGSPGVQSHRAPRLFLGSLRTPRLWSLWEGGRRLIMSVVFPVSCCCFHALPQRKTQNAPEPSSSLPVPPPGVLGAVQLGTSCR